MLLHTSTVDQICNCKSNPTSTANLGKSVAEMSTSVNNENSFNGLQIFDTILGILFSEF